MNSKYESLFQSILKDIDSTLVDMKQIEESFPTANAAFKVNMALLVNKVINFICTKLDDKCRNGLDEFEQQLNKENH